MDLQMPVREWVLYHCIQVDKRSCALVDGEGAARYIKSTNNKNTNTPIIAVSAYSGIDPNETSNVFAASLSKPVQKADLLGEFSEWCCITRINVFTQP